MKTAQLLAAIVVASSIPLIAQQPGSSPPQQEPPAQQAPPSQSARQATSPGMSSAPAAQAPEMKPVNGELVDNLDSKTAKTGDTVTIETKQAVTTADGTQIPQGSKIVGHVLGVKASGQGNENSQVALAFDRAELKGGQSVPVKAELRSLSPAGGETQSNTPSSMGAAPGSQARGAGASGGNGAGSATQGSTTGSASAASTPGSSAGQPPSQGGNVPGASQGSGQPGAAGGPLPAGVVVARTGNIDIKTTAIPGVLLANNQPGMQDPRMAQSSGILLGARRDIHLDGGTQVVIAVAGGGTTGGGN